MNSVSGTYVIFFSSPRCFRFPGFKTIGRRLFTQLKPNKVIHFIQVTVYESEQVLNTRAVKTWGDVPGTRGHEIAMEKRLESSFTITVTVTQRRRIHLLKKNKISAKKPGHRLKMFFRCERTKCTERSNGPLGVQVISRLPCCMARPVTAYGRSWRVYSVRAEEKEKKRGEAWSVLTAGTASIQVGMTI